MRSSIGLMTLLLGFASSGSIAVAAPGNSGVTYQGRILKPNGQPLEGANVQFRLQLRTPDSAGCLMYEELQAIDMRDSNGQFALTINDGTGARVDSTGLTLDRIFANIGTFNLNVTTCSTGTGAYAPNAGDGRTLAVSFKDETMSTWEPVPPQKINYVPFAFEAKQIAGFSAANLLRFAESDGTLVNTTPLNNAQYTELLSVLAGTSTAYERAGRLGGVSLPTLGAGQAGQVLSWNGTGWATSTPFSGTSSQWSNGASGAVSYVGGNVGIGTSAPASSPLTVNNPTGSGNTLLLDLRDNGWSRASIDTNGNALLGAVQAGNGVRSQVYGPTPYTPTSSTTNQVDGSAMTASNNSMSNNVSFGGISLSARNLAGTHMESFIGAVSNPGGLSPSTVFVHQTGATSYAERMRIHSDGNVGIGTAAPTSKLQVAGTMVSSPATVNVGATVDLSASNTTVLNSVGGTLIALTNPTHGGNYTIVVKDTTVRTYDFSGCATKKFLPAQGDTLGWSLFTILTLDNGAGGFDCMITWATGYQ